MKKVLISLDELNKVIEDNNCCCYYKDGVQEWFDAQPDWLNRIQNATKIMSEADEAIKSLLSKTETTGGENDN